MEVLRGFVIILLCNFAGDLVVSLLHWSFPGAVIGLLVLLLLLITKVVKLSVVEAAGRHLVALMMLFILPGAVNLMNVFGKLSGIILQVVLITILSTLLSLLSSSFVADRLLALQNKRRQKGGA